MKSTTLKLPVELKRRIGPLARRTGKTPHAWMVETLRSETERSELRERFLDEAQAAADAIDAGGPVFALDDVDTYLRARIAGKKPRRPRPVKR